MSILGYIKCKINSKDNQAKTVMLDGYMYSKEVRGIIFSMDTPYTVSDQFGYRREDVKYNYKIEFNGDKAVCSVYYFNSMHHRVNNSCIIKYTDLEITQSLMEDGNNYSVKILINGHTIECEIPKIEIHDNVKVKIKTDSELYKIASLE